MFLILENVDNQANGQGVGVGNNGNGPNGNIGQGPHLQRFPIQDYFERVNEEGMLKCKGYGLEFALDVRSNRISNLFVTKRNVKS